MDTQAAMQTATNQLPWCVDVCVDVFILLQKWSWLYLFNRVSDGLLVMELWGILVGISTGLLYIDSHSRCDLALHSLSWYLLNNTLWQSHPIRFSCCQQIPFSDSTGRTLPPIMKWALIPRNRFTPQAFEIMQGRPVSQDKIKLSPPFPASSYTETDEGALCGSARIGNDCLWDGRRDRGFHIVRFGFGWRIGRTMRRTGYWIRGKGRDKARNFSWKFHRSWLMGKKWRPLRMLSYGGTVRRPLQAKFCKINLCKCF